MIRSRVSDKNPEPYHNLGFPDTDHQREHRSIKIIKKDSFYTKSIIIDTILKLLFLLMTRIIGKGN